MEKEAPLLPTEALTAICAYRIGTPHLRKFDLLHFHNHQPLSKLSEAVPSTQTKHNGHHPQKLRTNI
ncbi:MAG: hypothetical protein IPM82_31320 [Saprospiraceae bacterium]|nr:hypothetical protein [Saprospiraceae bacterium]